MTTESTPMLAGRPRDNRKIEQIEEFFSLADLVHGESDDLDLAERQRRDCAKQRLELSKTSSER